MPVALEHFQVVVDHRGGRDAHPIADFADARRIAALVDVGLDVLQDILLAFRQFFGRHTLSPPTPPRRYLSSLARTSVPNKYNNTSRRLSISCRFSAPQTPAPSRSLP